MLNLFLIIFILVDPLKILRKGPWITIINLAVADLAVCISILLLVAIEVTFDQIRIVLGSAVSTSFMLLAFFSLQVYTVTKFPFKARHFWTRKRVVLCCVGIWLLVGLLGSGEVFSYRYEYDKQFMWRAITFAIWSITAIFQIILKILTCWEIFKTRRNSGQSQSSKHRQLTTTVMIMVVIQMFTAFPFVVTYQFLPIEWPYTYKIVTFQWCMGILNFCVNPIIYFLRLPDYRSSLLSLFGRRKRKNQTSSDPQRNEQRELPLHQVPPTTPQPSS